ncbi:MAG: AIR synthase-related protein, partial [Thermoprotei archaeon]
PVHPLTRTLCKKMKIDPLRLISSGSLLIAVRPEGAEQTLLKLGEKGYLATAIGEFTRGPMRLIRKSGRVERLTREPVDELWRTFKQTPNETWC